MKSDQFIRKLRASAVISFLIPLIAINLCLFIYKFLGDFNTFAPLDWGEKKIELTWEQENLIHNNLESWTFVNCPKYKYKKKYHTTDNKIKSIVRIQQNIIEKRCVKNFWFGYLMLNNFRSLEKFMLIGAKNDRLSGFAKVKNPYLYGEVSISRTARYYPSTLIFKPFVILGSIFLLIYWKNNLNLFKELENKNILTKFSKKFFYMGVFSCIFLILHALFLGLDFDSELFKKIRRLIIILFIVFEIFAQFFLTRILFKFKEELKNYINPLFLKIKITFVAIIFFVTSAALLFLIWGDLDSSHKNILEWNYFTALLFYYLLSTFLWRSKKTKKF